MSSPNYNNNSNLIVSVVIPLYNRTHLVRQTLDSLDNSLHPGVNLDIIVVDDGSTDGGDIMISNQYKHIRLFRQENSGAPVARNKGLTEAYGDFVLFLDSDDLVEPDFFSKKIFHLIQNPDIAAVYGPWEHFEIDSEGKRITIPRHAPYPLENAPSFTKHLERILSGWYIIPHALLWRKNILKSIGGYNVALPINQDVDLLWRILVSQNKIAGIQSPVALYRAHSEENRVGDVNSKKLEAIYNLRLSFVDELNKNNLLTLQNKIALSTFCFNYWQKFRTTEPVIAEKFYSLSQKTYPNIKLQGGVLLRLINRFFSARKTILIKSFLESCKKH